MIFSHNPLAGLAVGGNGLLNNLVGAWELDEVSGTRFDSEGSNDLTDNNTVGSATGIISNAASFVSANSESLSSTTEPISGTGARTTEIWFKTSTTGTMHLYGFGTSNSGVAGGAWRLSIESGALFCRVYAGAANFGGSFNDGNWHQAIMQVPAASTVNDVTLYIDGSLQSQVSGSTRAINTGTGIIELGQDIQSGGGSFYNGLLDMFRVWSKELTSGERADLFNSGSGLAYSAFTT